MQIDFMPRKLYFITHPDVVIDPKKYKSFWELSAEGIGAAKRVAIKSFWKDINNIYTSTEIKTIQTAEIINKKHKIPYESTNCLNEFESKSTGFLPIEEFIDAMKSFYEKPAESFRGWERLIDAEYRVLNCIKKITRMPENSSIAIIGHGATGTLLKCFYKGVTPSWEEDPKQTGCYFIADIENKKLIQDWKKY